MKFGKAGKNKHAEKINLLNGKPALDDTESRISEQKISKTMEYMSWNYLPA